MVAAYWQIYFQEDTAAEPELKLQSTSCSSPIIDPHVSPDGTMLAYVRDNELHVLNLLSNTSKQLTLGADGNFIVSIRFQFLFDLFIFPVLYDTSL